MASQKIIIAGGSPAAGKTSVLAHYIKTELEHGRKVSAVKIDCLHSEDDAIYRSLGIPTVLGLSKDLCPDHYLAVNLEEIVEWSLSKNADILVIETAGLCHRCAPYAAKTISICVLDCVSSIKVPQKIGPILTTCDIMVITKSDMISQGGDGSFLLQRQEAKRKGGHNRSERNYRRGRAIFASACRRNPACRGHNGRHFAVQYAGSHMLVLRGREANRQRLPARHSRKNEVLACLKT